MDRSGPSQSGKPRKELNWWHSFNSWWRDEYDRLGRRPRMMEVDDWYHEHAERIWGAEKPSLEATRDHAKCLRSKKELREYFQRYNAKKQLGRPFTDLRQMRGSRQRSGSQQGAASTRSPGSISDPVCIGGGISGGTSGGISAGMSVYEGYCDGSSGVGEPSGGTAATQQTAGSSQLLSALTESPIYTETANRAHAREPLREQGHDQVESDDLACYGDGAMPSALASSLANALYGDALLLGPGEGYAPGRVPAAAACGGAGRGNGGGHWGACNSAGDANGAPRPRWMFGDHQLNHIEQQTNESGGRLGYVDLRGDVSAAAAAAEGCLGRTGDTHQPKLWNSQTQPSCNDNSECAAAVPSAKAELSISAATQLASALNAQAGLQRTASHARQDAEVVVLSHGMQARHLHACQPSPHVDTAVAPGTGGSSSGDYMGTPAAGVVGSEGAEPSLEPYTGSIACVSRWLAGLASSALSGQHVSLNPVLGQGRVREGNGEVGPVHGCSSVAPSVIGPVLDGEVPEPGALQVGLPRRATENDSVPSPPATAPPPPPPLPPLPLPVPPQQKATPPFQGNAQGEELEDTKEFRNQAAVVKTACKRSLASMLAKGQPFSSSQDAAAATAALAPASPDGLGMVDGGYDAEECNHALGPSTTPSHDHHQQQRHYVKYHQQNHFRNDSSDAPGIDSSGQMLTRSSSGRAPGGVGLGSGDAAAEGRGPNAFMIHHSCEEEAVALGPGEPSLAALLGQAVGETGDGGSVDATADAHALPLSCRSSGAFTGAGAEEPSTRDVNGTDAAVSVGNKRSAWSLGLLRAPSLCAPVVEGEPDTPSLHRAPKLLRPEQVQHAPGRRNLTQRTNIATSGVAATSVSGHRANPNGVLNTGCANTGSQQGGNNGSSGDAGPAAAVLRGPPPAFGSAPAQGAAPPIGLPPDPFRMPMLLHQRSIGKDGMAVQLGGGGGGGNGLTSAPLLLLTRESVSTRSGMPPPPPLLPRESVGTANVLPVLMPRDSLEARLMPPPPLPIHERSSTVSSSPPSTAAVAQHHPVEHPHEMLQPQFLQQQLLHNRHGEQHKQQQHQQQGPAHAAMLGSDLDDLGRAVAMGVSDKGRSQVVPSALLPPVRDGVSDGKAPQQLVSFSFPTPSPGILQETAMPVAPCQPAPSATFVSASDRTSRSVPILLQSGGVEHVCVRQPTDDGRLVERPLQVITVRLTLPAASLGALRQVMPPPPPPLQQQHSGQLT